MVDEARAEGIDVTIDQYPTITAAQKRRAAFPLGHRRVEYTQFASVLPDPGTRTKIAEEIKFPSIRQNPANGKACSVMERSGRSSGGLLPEHPQWEGKNLQEISEAMNVDPVEAAFRSSSRIKAATLHVMPQLETRISRLSSAILPQWLEQTRSPLRRSKSPPQKFWNPFENSCQVRQGGKNPHP